MLSITLTYLDQSYTLTYLESVGSQVLREWKRLWNWAGCSLFNYMGNSKRSKVKGTGLAAPGQCLDWI